MMVLRAAWLGLLFLSLAGGLAAQAPYEVGLELGECLFDSPDPDRISCGTLTVPQDRSDPAGVQVTIPFAILKASDWFPRADPLIYLNGGPGAETIASYGAHFDDVFAAYANNRDVILFDYRGVGLATPSLDCPKLDVHNRVADDFDYQVIAEECRQALLAAGVNFDLYDSATMAQDIVDLWTTLGYTEVNLLGLSYGSRIALTIMRDHPAGVRSAILDGPLPLQIDEIATSGSRYTNALEVLFDACAKDPACRTAYPKLDAVVAKLLEQLEATPVELMVTPLSPTYNGASYPLEVDGTAVLGLIFDAMYSSWRVTRLPRILATAGEGDYGLLNREFNLSGFGREGFSEGIQIAMRCNEELPFAQWQITDLLANLGSLLRTGSLNPCADWVSNDAQQIENEAVYSEIPALVVTGQFDPVTPPEWSDITAETLPNSYVYTFPGLGHTVSLDDNECASDMVQEFLDEPEYAPDSDCLSTLQATFDTPVTKVELVEYEAYGINGVIPANWVYENNTYFPSRSSYTMFHYAYSGAAGASDILDWAHTAYGVSERGQPQWLKVGQYGWEVYRLQGTQYAPYITLGVASLFDDWHVVIVMTSVSAAEDELLYKNLFVPAMEGFYYE